jgi:hypothetical protein
MSDTAPKPQVDGAGAAGSPCSKVIAASVLQLHFLVRYSNSDQLAAALHMPGKFLKKLTPPARL